MTSSVASDDRAISEQWFGNNMKAGAGLLSLHLARGPDKKHENSQSRYRSQDPDLNAGRPEIVR